MKAVFHRKMLNLVELNESEQHNEQEDFAEYVIVETIILTKKDYQNFVNNFQEDLKFQMANLGGIRNGKVQATLIKCRGDKTQPQLLVNREGYDYARYIAIKK